METFHFPEIDQLKSLREKYKISIHKKNNTYLGNDMNYPGILFKVGEQTFNLFVYDEYNDLHEDNQLLCLCLTLKELEQYSDTTDYLQWCKEAYLDVSNQEVRNYHIDLRIIHSEIEKIIGPVDSCISNFDFELNSGAAQWLRIYGKSVE